MTIADPARKTPFPWFGGKRDAAPSHRERLYLSPHCLTEPTDGLW